MATQYVLEGAAAWLGLDDPTDTQLTLLSLAVENAEAEINRIRATDELEDKYRSLAIEMAVYLYEKRGVDGVSSLVENGISRVYERGSFPVSMLRRITPKANASYGS